MLQQVGSVAYKLDLPPKSKLHLVFHVSLLRKQIGQHAHVHPHLPPITNEGVVQPEPFAILARWMVKKGNKAATEVLVHWTNLPKDDTTWKHYYEFKTHFSRF